MNTFKWLLKREYWENKGGLTWAPGIIGALSVVLGVVMALAFTYAIHTGNMQHDGVAMTNLSQVMDAEAKTKAVEMVASNFVFALAPMACILFFVMFFYLLGALYDDRSNRSILFWKSMPVSDRDTVLSKLATGLVAAPVITMVIAAVVGFILAVIALAFFSANGLHIVGAVLSDRRFYTLPLEFLAALPPFVLWALPTAGWLLMVSAWAKSKPFLWAVGIPVIAGVLISWMGAIIGMFGMHLDISWYWKHVAGRLLLSVLPGSWGFLLNDPGRYASDSLQHGSPLLSSWYVLASPDLWIGVLVGTAMILAAIRLRRWRDEG